MSATHFTFFSLPSATWKSIGTFLSVTLTRFRDHEPPNIGRGLVVSSPLGPSASGLPRTGTAAGSSEQQQQPGADTRAPAVRARTKRRGLKVASMEKALSFLG